MTIPQPAVVGSPSGEPSRVPTLDGAKSRQVVAYLRVSTVEQGESGAGLAAQEALIRRACEARGWDLVAIHQDVASGAKTKRAGLDGAIRQIERGEASALVVAKLDRLSRSMVDFAQLLERAKRKRWQLVVLDFDLDMTTPAGELVASVLAALAQWERRIISQRTKDALAVRKAEGVQLGRWRSGLDGATVERIRLLRESGEGYYSIAKTLNAEGVPTSQGGAQWWASTVRAVLGA